MLSCRDLVFRQGGKVLWQNLTFRISAGERVGIHAPSGTGKTTWGRVLAGWQKTTAGDVLLDGSQLLLHQYGPVPLVPQHPELRFIPCRSAGDGVREV
ncbi:ATP-binding cassette domain-containing protein, partial [Salmonella enterica]|uniref:ATP-binding cassette domain-containing protein n=1 Tax=Salmonella enterica TaxID=28901 RepID=UPI002ADEF203